MQIFACPALHGRRSCLRGIRSGQWSEAALRSSVCTLQSHALCHANGRLHDECPAIRAFYRTDGQLLNQCRVHFQPRVFTTTAHELLIADDCTLNATLEGDMQRSMFFFTSAFENFSLAINTEKTLEMHQSPLDSDYVVPRINMNSTQLRAVDNLTYRTAAPLETPK
nr:unnamed protein product [Spirometra erinaceieuropaei]